MQPLPPIALISPGRFSPENHQYPQVCGVRPHAVAEAFVRADHEMLAAAFCRRHDEADQAVLLELLKRQPRHFFWSGADVIFARTPGGPARPFLIETNSCPSGQKSMPLLDGVSGYERLLREVFLPRLSADELPDGMLAVIYDKNPLENSGYAAVLANLMRENVLLVPFSQNAKTARWQDGVLMVTLPDGRETSVRACLRYVTERPWESIPAVTRTFVCNPVTACLSGGRDKARAETAYAAFEQTHAVSGLRIARPQTLIHVERARLGTVLAAKGFRAAIKDPRSHAGQGVLTVASREEWQKCESHLPECAQFVVQELIGDGSQNTILTHAGTLPDASGARFAFDLRIVVGAGKDGWLPLSLYARRAHVRLGDAASSWDVLGTNLSVRSSDGDWQTEPERLIPVDEKNFESLNLSFDDLAEAFILTVLATHAIDMQEDHGDQNGA